MMNWRKVVCVLCAGLLCTGLVLANGPAKPIVVKPTPVAHKAPAVQTSTVTPLGPVVRSQSSLASQNGPQTVQATKLPAGTHVRPLGASRLCVNYVWDNIPNTVYYWGASTTLPIDSQVGVPIADANQISCYYIEVITTADNINITTELVPVEGGTAYPGTTFTTNIATAGGWGITVDLPSPVDVSADMAKGYIIVRQTWDVGAGGPLMGEYAELGANPPGDWFYWNGGYYWFGGNPKSWFSASLFGPEDTAFTGACCDMGACFETDDYYTCQYVYGLKWFAFENCPDFTGCPQVGACCKGGVCLGTMYEVDCTNQAGRWFVGENCDTYICPPGPPNDNCGDVTPVTIPNDSSYTWTGNNLDATSDCSMLGWQEVWLVFTTESTQNVRVDFCGSPTYFSTIGIWMLLDCPCSAYTPAGYYAWDCPDGNAHIDWYGLPAGTYYYPIYSVPPNAGDYVATVTTTTPPPPPPRDNCGDVTPDVLAPGSPLVYTGDNTGATSDCPVLGWPEIWFPFTIADTYTVKIDWCDSPTYQGTISIAMVPDCPCTSWFGASAYAWDCPDGNPHLSFFNLAAGTYYFPMYSAPGSTGPYQITLTALAPCDVTCPPGAVNELEVCGDLYPNGTNGGCNSTPPAFEPIALNTTVCGTTWADNSYRDTDWYEVTTTDFYKFTWTIVGEGPMLGFIMDGTGGCGAYSVIGSATADPCAEATIQTTSLPPGTYWFWAGLSTWGNYPCDQVYYGTLVAEVASPDYCAAGASVCDEYISQVDFGAFSNPTGCGLGSNGTPGYSDYTAMTIDVDPGNTYTLTVTNGNPIWTADTCGAWVDWNDNFIFTDAGEFFDMGTGVGPYSTAITIPAAPGHHRLRIRVDYVNAPNPCGISSYGEVEDYTLNVTGGALLGDINCDGFVNAFDIDPFVQCLVSGTPTPPCTDCSAADINGDGFINAFDIDPFVACIIAGGCP